VGTALPEEISRLVAARKGNAAAFPIMADFVRSFTPTEASKVLRALEPFELSWVSEPLPIDDLRGYERLRQVTTIPIAVGKSLHSLFQFREFLQREACSVVQLNVGSVGGITPWLKIAHLAEAFNAIVVPSSATEVHVGLCCAVPNAPYLEYFPQLSAYAKVPVSVEMGLVLAPTNPGVGLDLDLGLIVKSNVLGAILEYPPSKTHVPPPPSSPKVEPKKEDARKEEAKKEEPKKEEPKKEEPKKEESNKEEPKKEEPKKEEKKEEKKRGSQEREEGKEGKEGREKRREELSSLTV